MDNVGRKDLVRSEPLRLGVATLAWTAAPFLGVWLLDRYAVWAPSLMSLGAVGALVAAFWVLRLKEGNPIRPGRAQALNPRASVRRFAAQPRLRLAWAIAFARSAFWVTFFIYIPILMVEGGLGAMTGGLAVAAGNLMLFANLFVQGVTRRFTLRRVLGGAFLGADALVAVTAGLSNGSVVAAGVAMVAAAFFVAIIDGLGPIPFLRTVHVHERPAMTTVYRTYLDASELLPPLVYAGLLAAFGFAGAFAALAGLMAGSGWMVLRYLPRGM